MKTAIIIGCNGQDGQLLFALLQQRGYQVVGIGRTIVKTTSAIANLPDTIDICRAQEIFNVLQIVQADEIYHLAAYHHSSQDVIDDAVDLFERSYQINVASLSHVLEGIRLYSPATRLFYAASSHIFGHSGTKIQTEETPLSPHTIYGVHKSTGLLLCQMYRKNYGVFASVGILYNHESALRSEKFVSRKIVKAVVAIKYNQQQQLELGDTQSIIDWGYAPDFVRAMWLILQQPQSDEYIIATGKSHTVQDFVEAAFDNVDLQPQQYVRVNPSIITRSATILLGKATKLQKHTGWQPSVSFNEMVKILVNEEMKQYETA